MTPEPVVVTGMGIACAAGVGIEAFAAGLFEGKPGIRPIRSFDTTGFALPDHTLLGGEVADLPEGQPRVPSSPSLDLAARAADKTFSSLDRVQKLALLAAVEAWTSSGDSPGGERTGVVLGTVTGGIRSGETFLRKTRSSASTGADLPCRAAPESAALAVARELKLSPVNLTVNTACASGTTAVGLAFRMIRSGKADRLLAGGAEALSLFAASGFSALKLLTSDAIRPFDRRRSGFLLGEGAAFVVLERLSSARRRGANLFGTILGYGASADATGMVKPDLTGSGLARAMNAAIRDAALFPADVDAINAHATATVHNDLAESAAVHRVFGDRAAAVPVSAVKPLTGHALAASGAIETIASLLALARQTLPPTPGFEEPDPACGLNVIRSWEQRSLSHVLSISAGFMGHNAALLLGRADA
ncbi:MAG: beta-ketoacyl-[acyl-carrier-protein] synthase family protein [Nitrospirae bacterium]|nr:beta-ketoacyl-[acyl-carrier-protein] synthase family protein [Nitrospirota bacterium]